MLHGDPQEQQDWPTVDFRLLGPFEIVVAGEPRAAGGRAEQSLLALLLLNPGQVLPAARLIELLWEESAMPADPVNALQNRVSKTRRLLSALGPSGPRLATAAGGYRLELPRSAVDIHRFTDTLELARRITDSPAEADVAYECALRIWRGSALSGLEAEPWAEREIHRLHDLHLAATEERLSLAVASGRHREVLEQVRRLVDEHPLREGTTHLLMRALYLSGRQVEALDAYQNLRANLDDQLGLEPSPHLRDLEARILRQDPDLGLPTGPHVSVVAAPVGPSHAATPSRRALPRRVTSFVGREDESRHLLELLADSRIVTLSGPGGAGKTSLALEVARELQNDFDGGAVLVELAAVSDAVEVPQAFADALGLTLHGDSGHPAADQVVQHLTHQRLLLIVDNCEQVIEPTARLVNEVLRWSDDTTVIATSREALGVAGEVVFRVPPLHLPPPDRVQDDADLRGYPAIRLFLDRMIAANPLSSVRQRADEEAIASICQMLDGIPLAIELAAARTAVLGVNEIAERLEGIQRFSLLTDGSRTAESRQKTLRATVDWSYGLLSEEERKLLRRVSVFRGGWTLAAAEVVTTLDDLAPDRVIHLIGQLVHRSLVSTELGEQGTRCRLLETVRVYANERLAAAGESAAVQERHARWVLDLAEESAEELRTSRQGNSLARMTAEVDNIRTAVRWASEFGGDPDLPLLLAGSLAWFFYLGRHVEGKQVLARLSGRAQVSPEARARFLLAKSILDRPRVALVHPSPECGAAAAESMNLFRQAGNDRDAAVAQTLLAVEGVGAMPPDEAAAHLEAASEVFAREHYIWGQALVAFVRLAIEVRHGSVEAAEAMARQADDLFRSVGDDAARSSVFFHMGVGYRQAGHHAQGIDSFRAAAQLAEPLGLFNTVQWSLSAAGVCALGLDRLDEADDLFEATARTRSERGDPGGQAHVAHGKGLIARAGGDHSAAREYFAAAHERYRALGTPLVTAAALSGLAWSALGLRDLASASAAHVELTRIADETNDPLIRAWERESNAHMAAARGDVDDLRRSLDAAADLRRRHELPGLPFEQREVDRLWRTLAALTVSRPFDDRPAD